jgi:hypothetical protein
MKRHELEHIIRAAAAISDSPDLIVVGSQSILAQVPDAPDELTASIEADVYPKNDPERSILIDGAIGELSIFHQTFGYYAHGVSADTAVLPKGWEGRLVPLRNENTRGFTGWCLDVHDLAASKLVAGREKDVQFVSDMFRHGLIDEVTVASRLDETAMKSPECRPRISGMLKKILHPTFPASPAATDEGIGGHGGASL